VFLEQQKQAEKKKSAADNPEEDSSTITSVSHPPNEKQPEVPLAEVEKFIQY
jgi:hypothetical protein